MGEGVVTTTVFCTLCYETYLQDKGINIQRLYRMSSWTLLQLGKLKNMKELCITPNDSHRLYLTSE